MNAIRLRQILLDASEHVPFYRQYWKAAGVDLTRIASAVHLEFLPLVRRADLLACPQELRIDQRFIQTALRANGAAEQSFEMPVDRQSLRRRRWRFLHALMDVGYSPGERLMIISKPPIPRGAALLRWTYADLRLGEEAVFAKYERTRPNVLYGPLSSLVLLARRLLETPSVRWRPKLVVSTAAQLTDAYRALLESAFNTRVADFYETSELGLVAYGLPGTTIYRAFSRDFHLELLPAAADKGSGLERLVVTDLNAGVMPLIRFDTGDLVRRDPTRKGAPITQISGRQVESLKLASSAFVPPYEGSLALSHTLA